MQPLDFQKWDMRSPAGKMDISLTVLLILFAKSDVLLGNTSAQASPCLPSIKQICTTLC